MRNKSIKDTLIDFIEYEFNLEVTERMEGGLDILTRLIKEAKTKVQEDKLLDEDTDFWESAGAMSSPLEEDLFDSFDEDDDFDEE